MHINVCLHVYLCIICVLMPVETRKKASDLIPWNWSYKLFVSCPVSAGNQILGLCKPSLLGFVTVFLKQTIFKVGARACVHGCVSRCTRIFGYTEEGSRFLGVGSWN